MEAEDFLRLINEFDFICDDIDEIKGKLALTKSENQKILQAISSIEKAKKILTALFPNIKSLDSRVREDLEVEFADMELSE
jgi:tRNA A37 threonylcarbamoyladenosine dehydratase